jgi:Uma2 family endonuclease
MSTSVEEVETADAAAGELLLCLPPSLPMSEDQFFDFCQANENLQIERNSQGDLIIMPPSGCESGDRESEINMQVRLWAKRDGSGKTFSSSAGFHLPNGANRSPDTSWIRLTRWNALSATERKKFAPLCPDFVIELRSETDRLRTLQKKMQEYSDNGAEMGLLIDPLKRQVHVYRRGREAEILDGPETVSCEPLLPGFALDLREIW